MNWGYFSLDLQYTRGKFSPTKLLSLNSNICYAANWATFMQYEDPGNMLHWLQDELTEIEKNNGTAFVMGHVPNLNECTS